MFYRILKAIRKRIIYLIDVIHFQRLKKEIRTKFEDLKLQVKESDECLIVANGPSVNSVDFSKYPNHKIITMNRAYVKWDDLFNRKPFLHVCVNLLVMNEFKNDMINLDCPFFCNYSAIKGNLNKCNNNIYPILMGFFIGDRVTEDIASPFSSSGTVTFVALNLALLLGFKKIVIVGLDHEFKDKGEKNKTVTMTHDDENHFFGSYFPKGMQWELPDLERSERGYRIIQDYCLEKKVVILNESTHTKCDVFPRSSSKD